MKYLIEDLREGYHCFDALIRFQNISMSKNGSREESVNSVYIDRLKAHDDLSILSKAELLERLGRQNKLINSPALLRLPDRGEKVKLLKKQLEEEIKKREKSIDISELFISLSIKEKNVDKLEWGFNEADIIEEVEQNNEVNSFTDEKDPLAILATHCGTNLHKIRLKTDPEPPLITNEDLYALNLCNKVDKSKPKEKFLPYKTLNTVIEPSRRYKIRDLSSATPPPPVYDDAKLISLQDSIKLQIEHDQRLKEIQRKVAADRLKNSLHQIGDWTPEGGTFQTYREKVPAESDSEAELDNDSES